MSHDGLRAIAPLRAAFGAWSVVLLLGTAPGLAAEIGGFAQVNGSVRTTGAPCDSGGPCDLLLEDERLELKVEGSSEQARSAFAARVDFFQDAVEDRSGIEVREAFVDLNGSRAALRAGRQVITWGVGDLLFTNDLFPKDWAAFFSGRPLEYLKAGSDALKLDLHPKPADLELVVLPAFQPDRLPGPDRFVLPAFPPASARIEVKPSRSLEHAELAGRLTRGVSDWTLGLYAARTFYRSPAAAYAGPANPIVMFYPRANLYGLSATGSFLKGVLGAESAYLYSVEDRSGTNPFIENSMMKGLLGYSRSFRRDGTVGVQGYLEWMMDYDRYRASLLPGTPARDERRSVATLRLTQLLRNQTVTLGFFGFWGVTDHDGYLIPSARYAATDNLWIELGGNLFAGRHAYTMFGALDENDNVYATMRYGF